MNLFLEARDEEGAFCIAIQNSISDSFLFFFSKHSPFWPLINPVLKENFY